MKTKKIILITLITVGTFISCSKVADAVLEEATPLTSSDLITEANIDSTIDDISNLVQDQYGVQALLASKPSVSIIAAHTSILPSCATATGVLKDNTYTRTIDFGTTGCVLNNGNTIKGKIIMTFTKEFDLSNGVVRTINYSLVNFYHNGNLVVGDKSITISKKTTTQLATVHTVITHAIDTKITFADNKTYTRKGTLTRELIEGEATLALADNVYAVTGATNTTLPNGAIVTNTITSALILKASCDKPYPLQGSVTTAKNSYEAIIDFGKGECDNLATFTTKGITLTFELKRP